MLEDQQPEESIFSVKLHNNSQVTIPAKMRDSYSMEAGDTVFLEIKSIVSATGERKYPGDKDHGRKDADTTQ